MTKTRMSLAAIAVLALSGPLPAFAQSNGGQSQGDRAENPGMVSPGPDAQDMANHNATSVKRKAHPATSDKSCDEQAAHSTTQQGMRNTNC